MKNGDIYVDTTEDTIMNRDLQEKDQVNIDTVVSDVKQKEVVLKLLEETSGSTPKTRDSKIDRKRGAKYAGDKKSECFQCLLCICKGKSGAGNGRYGSGCAECRCK